MESKKISFGFSKITKKSNILIKKPPDDLENKIELIKCLEGQEIKLVDEKPIIPTLPLVIPLRGSSKTSAALASLQKRKAILEGTAILINETESNNTQLQVDETTKKPIEEETIEKRAARELLKEISDSSKLDNDNSTLSLPIKSADELPLEGAIESTIDDYENIPIQNFGKAMLRGMGWKEEVAKKDPGDIEDGPVRRPKGMGLGADKSIKRHVPLIPADKNEVLEIKKKAFVRIIGGKNKDLYGQIEGFDDYSTRIIVRFALGGHTDGIHEFMIQPVSKKEYQQYSKVINSAKYDQYKKLENEHGQIIIKEEDRIKLELNNLKLKKESEIKEEIKSEDRQTENKKHSSINKMKRHSSTESLNKDEKRKKRSRSRDKNMRERRRHNSSSLDSNKSNDSSPHRRNHKSKKKSSKSKKSKKNKHHRSSSSENDKRHKKKTKRSKRSRSRSKGRK